MIGAGGTPGGIPQFFLGLAMAVVGAYLLTQQVTVQTSSWTIGGYNAFGLSLVPFLVGIGLIFFDGRSKAGLALLMLGVLIIAAGILMNLTIYFQPTSLFNTLMMLGLTAAGIGLALRAAVTADPSARICWLILCTVTASFPAHFAQLARECTGAARLDDRFVLCQIEDVGSEMMAIYHQSLGGRDDFVLVNRIN